VGQDLNPGPPKYDAGVVTTQLQYLVAPCLQNKIMLCIKENITKTLLKYPKKFVNFRLKTAEREQYRNFCYQCPLIVVSTHVRKCDVP
jgi:hypothetical protein